MPDFVLHALTKAHLEHFMQAPSHAVVLVGPAGAGKGSLAEQLTERVLGLESGQFAACGYAMQLSSEDRKAIGIEAVRQLNHFLSLKVPGSSAFNRAVIIQDGHLLTDEAQNALLKTLEEPPDGTLLILTVNHLQSLLPTIRSRLQTIPVRVPHREALIKHFAQAGYSTADISQAHSVSGGLPGLMDSLLAENDHPLRLATGTAKEFLSRSLHDRLMMIDPLAKNRDQAIETVSMLQRMARQGIQGAKSEKMTARWLRVERASYEAEEALRGSAQPKLVLTNLALQV